MFLRALPYLEVYASTRVNHEPTDEPLGIEGVGKDVFGRIS
jgi:hypothetical protein